MSKQAKSSSLNQHVADKVGGFEAVGVVCVVCTGHGSTSALSSPLLPGKFGLAPFQASLDVPGLYALPHRLVKFIYEGQASMPPAAAAAAAGAAGEACQALLVDMLALAHAYRVPT